MTDDYALNIEQIRKYLPHRPPFLLVDRILEIHTTGSLDHLMSHDKVGTKVIGLKNVSYNEPHFKGHFPEYSIMPGVLVIEAMAQTASFSIYPQVMRRPANASKQVQCFLVGVDNTRFRRPVIPGDQLRMETTVTKTRGKLWAFNCFATVNGIKVAEADIMANWLLDTGEST